MQAPKAFSYARFSSPEQLKGDSLRRQTQLSKSYAEKHGLILDDSVRMVDKGLSAFHGVHKTKGALGEFLKLVQEGQIPQGSVLLVENLDRLSREQVLDALNQFTSIIQAGIRIVTLQDGQEYCQESINENWAQLIISITYMARAHSESQLKSDRLKSAWKEKRNKAVEGEKKLTSRCPAWLRLTEDKTEFILIPEAAKAIELIYRKRLAGKGFRRIERELNDDPNVWKPDKIGPLKTSGWRKSYITKILNTKAVIGHFQPRKQGQPIGEPITDYFPPAIDPELFYQVQSIIQSNSKLNGNAGGRPDKANNLFVHLVKCGLCGSPLHYIDKGKPPRGGKYLSCDRAKRLKECPAKAVRYDEFEQLFFDNFEELNIQEFLPGKDDFLIKQNDLKRRIIVAKQMLLEANQEIENYTDTIGRTKDSRIREQLEKRLSGGFDNKEKLEAEIKEFEKELTALKQMDNGLGKGIEQANEIYKLMESAQEEERIDLRFRLRQQIRGIVERIEIFPLQESFKEFQPTEEEGIYKIMRSKYIDKVRIKFKGGKDFRVLYLKNHAELVE